MANINELGKSDNTNYTHIPEVVGEDILCIEAKTFDTVQKYGDLINVSKKSANYRMYYYKVVKVGVNVTKNIGVREGDYIFVDMLARYADTFPISFIHYKNVLFKTNESGEEIKALNNRVIVKIVEPVEIINEFGFIQKTDIDPYGLVVSIGDTDNTRNIKIGDKLGVINNDDTITYMLKNVKYFDYNINHPVFKFV